jgi:hypothetical protein
MSLIGLQDQVNLIGMANECSADLSDFTGGYTPSVAGGAEVHARFLDFLARKKLAISGSLESLFHRLESTLQKERLKSALQSLVAKVCRSRKEGEVTPGEWQSLVERIHNAGREGTIESYTAYLFSVDTRF